MESSKGKKITDEMIGMDDKICSCSSIVGDIILSQKETKEKKTHLKRLWSRLEKAKNLKTKGDLYNDL